MLREDRIGRDLGPLKLSVVRTAELHAKIYSSDIQSTSLFMAVRVNKYQGGTDGRDSLVVVGLSRFLVRSWGTTPKFEFLAGNSNY